MPIQTSVLRAGKIFLIFFENPLKTLYNFSVMKYNADTLAS